MARAEDALPPGGLRGFWCLIAAQFQNAFNDNAFKNLLFFLILGMNLPAAERDRLVLVLGIVFATPPILFSMSGGFLADRFSKRTVALATKLLEVGVMLVALAALALHNIPLCLAALFLMSSQSALFAPTKYGILPELLPEKRLSWGNGVLELGTFLAILAGIIAGPLLAEWFAGRQAWSGALLLGLAVIGLTFATGIPRLAAADPEKKFRANFLAELWEQITHIRGDRVLVLAVAGNTYFFFIAALLQLNILLFGNDVLRLGYVENGYLSAAIAVGIGLGSLAAGYLSGNKIEYGLVPLGSLGMMIFGGALAYGGHSFREVLALLGLLGFFAGFFIVPINALLQHRPEEERRGGVIAAANLISWIAVGLAAAANFALTQVGLGPHEIFLFCSVLTLATTGYAIFLLPDALLRLGLVLLTHSVYRIRLEGRDNIPEKGGALFVCNHLSFVDALLLMAATDRRVRFIMFKGIYEHPIVKPFARVMRAIPISSQLRPREMIRSLRAASDAIRDGEVVCIFAEGQITRIGHLLPFRRGLEMIMKGIEAPIIPVHLDEVWGSIFSFERGRFLWKVPRRVPYPVTVSFGKPLSPSATPMEVRQAVMELQTEAYKHHRARMRPLHRMFLRRARWHPFRFAMADGRVPHMSFATTLTQAMFVAHRLAGVWKGQEMVGVLLPPSVGGALVNIAASFLGKIPVNLNYTASAEVLESCARQCSLQTVITSRLFLEKVKIEVPTRAVFLEDVVEKPRLHEKLMSLLIAWTFPEELVETALGAEKRTSLDDLATVIFSSGSTGDPKGVMLTHFNIGSNLEQIAQTFALRPKDRILGILPFFHSMGYTVTLWLPATLGVGVVFHPNPLDAKGISELARDYQATFLVATPTFLQAYIRRCSPEDFGSLQFVLVGAEKLPDRVAMAFEDTFGLRPLEGYGCTECAPAVAVNTRDYRAPGFRQVGAKRGSIGHPLPGVSVRIVHPETQEPVPIGQPGLLLVRGPNVMTGYLGRPEKTAEVLRGGWYNTGDIASMDLDGFLIVSDRLSRFSKIAGEMVPHVKIEEKLQEIADITEQVFAVTCVPDDKKGERLIVLHTLPEEKLEPVLEQFANCELPPLWKPKPGQFFHVDNIPYLGTGKLDLRKLKDVAQKLAAASGETAVESINQ
ncbi:MAG TPA: acyl-[ACP]--phospholipid O-acyltransferase [Terriglobales bacterium]|nr:acyl-[ACP]--phospholipid O-acyltransferase [Terriglobales bacterium]